jgi:hypothetical protein
VSLSDLIAKGKTGDIFIVAYPTKSGRLVKFFTKSKWTHCSFLVKKDDEFFVVEMARYNDELNGLVMTPLPIWARKHKRCCVVYRPISKDTLRYPDQFIEEHSSSKPDLNVVNWLKTMKKTRYYREKTKSRYYCSEFVMRYFQYEGVVKKKYDPASYTPRELATKDLDWIDGWSHGETYLLEPPSAEET